MANEVQSNTAPCLNRSHIDNLLIEAFQKPLTTVVAEAGYGKTHAVSTFLASTEYKFAWLQLSELDNMIDILINRLASSVAVMNSTLAADINALGYSDSPASLYQLLRLIEGEIKHKERFVFVFDDFHLIQDKTVLYFFEKLVTANIRNLSVVLISRRRLDLALANMLSRGLMARVTEDDLRFSQDEMLEYLKMQDVELNSDEKSSLYEYTEGWILAIYLVCLSYKRRNALNFHSISRAKNDIFGLINEELFCVTSERMQRLLIRLSLLDTIPAGLLKELAKETPELLSEIADCNLLIRYDPHTDYYRMHRLFKDFLLERQVTLTKDEVMNVNLTAAQWYVTHNQPEESVSYYRKCGHYVEIFDFLLSIRKRITNDAVKAYIMLIDEAPDTLVSERPIIRVLRAQYLFYCNRMQEAHRALIMIREEYEALPPSKDRWAILGETYLSLALLSIVEQTFEFVELFKKADEYLPDGSILVDYTHLYIAEGINITGIKNPEAGELKRYRDALFTVAPYASRVMNGCGYGMEFLNATDASFMIGDMPAAERHAYETIYHAQLQRQYGFEFMANFYLSRIFMYKGDYTKIALLYKQMKTEKDRLNNANCVALYDIIEGWFYVKIGQPEKVAKWILNEEETRKILAPVALGREYLVRSDCMLAEGKYLELLGFMKQTDVFYEERGILYARIQNRITEAIIYHYLDDRQKSMDALTSAYNLSNGNDLIMQYVEYGSKMRTVVNAALQDEMCTISREWLEMIRTKSSTYAKRIAHIVKIYNAESQSSMRGQIQLTKRELEILSCLCQGFTREEIATTCNLSVNTVRSIQQSIYNKLGAINSLDAVRIATRLELV